jgi:hypothetical protein
VHGGRLLRRDAARGRRAGQREMVVARHGVQRLGLEPVA